MKTKFISIALGLLVIIGVMYNNCSSSKGTPQGSLITPSGSTTPTPGGGGGGGCVALGSCPPAGGGTPHFVLGEDFNTMFASLTCNAPGAGCDPIIGPTSGKPLQVFKFAATCDGTSVNSWMGGMTQYHKSPNANPVPDTNWAPIRMPNPAHNEVLMTRDLQSGAYGGTTVDFLVETDANPISGLVSLAVNANFTAIAGCPSTAIPASIKGIFLNWDGATIYVSAASTTAGGVASSIVALPMTNDWYSMHFERNNVDYYYEVRKYTGVPVWPIVASKHIPYNEIDVYNGGTPFPVGHVLINSDLNKLVSFDNFNIEW